MAPAIERVDDEADGEPAEPHEPRRLLLDDDHDPRGGGAEAPEDREQRPVDSAEPEVRTRAVDELLVPPLDPERDDRRVGDREREHRAEGVHRPQELRLAGQDDRDRGEPREDDERQPWRSNRLVQPAEDLGQLPVAGHRVRDPRGADHAGVRRHEQDRRREHADVDLEPVLERAVQVEVLDEPEHRVVRVAAVLGREAEERLVLAARPCAPGAPRARSAAA